MKIRVNPQNLLSNANNISSISSEFKRISRDVVKAANSAPSYNGQFGPKVKAIGQSAFSSASRYSTALDVNSDDLRRHAKKFIDTDNFFSVRRFNLIPRILPWIKPYIKPYILRRIFPFILPYRLGFLEITAWNGITQWLHNEHHGENGFLNWNGINYPILGRLQSNDSNKTWYTTILGFDEIKWSGSGIFTWKSDSKEYRINPLGQLQPGKEFYEKYSFTKKGGFQGSKSSSSTNWEYVREKLLKWDIPIAKASGSLYEVDPEKLKFSETDENGKIISKGAMTAEIGKFNASAKMTIGGKDWLSAEAGADFSLASGKYTQVWGKEDDLVQGYFDGQVDVMKASGKVSVSKDGVEAKVGVSVIEASASGGVNIGESRVGVSVTGRIGWEFGFSAKKGAFNIDLGPISIGLDIGRKNKMKG